MTGEVAAQLDRLRSAADGLGFLHGETAPARLYRGSLPQAHGPALDVGECLCRHCESHAPPNPAHRRREAVAFIGGHPEVLRHVSPTSLTDPWSTR